MTRLSSQWSTTRWGRAAAFGVLTLWAPATAFFAVVGVRVARAVASRSEVVAHIVDLRGALVTAAYSLGGAAVGLGLAWLVLPAARTRGMRWMAWLWLAVTVLLLVSRRVSGWPLLIATLVATGIGLELCRRLLLTALDGRGTRP
ncbi:hypothetical protein [Gemmatimonas sp.]|uniref:hypothetical protein n=1 Tax=Gemmatimonas sp. TaxID=1962908 RepID=UPI00334071D6